MTIPQLTPAQVAARTTGAIAGSTAIPLGQLATRTGELDPATPVITVCQSGRRSQQAAEFLATAGFPVSNMAGGMNAWTQAGRPTV